MDRWVVHCVISSAADGVQHFADGLHGRQDVLLHSHIITAKVFVGNGSGSAADAGQQLAVASHVLNQILDHNVLHNKNTSKIECEKFRFYRWEQCAAQPSVKVL